MSFLDPLYLRCAPCNNVAPMYKQHLAENVLSNATKQNNPHNPGTENYHAFENQKKTLIAQIQAEMASPLEAVRRRMATEVENLFKKNGERTIILGCMHVNASREFQQSETDASCLFPKTILRNGEDHSHPKAVTVDLRYSPDERVTLPVGADRSLNTGLIKFEKIPSDGPDFARRNCAHPYDLEDFIYVERVNKIYGERLPFLEGGPVAQGGNNIVFFQAIHRLLGRGGIFAFDFAPNMALFNSKGDRFRPINAPSKDKVVSKQEIEDFMNNSTFSSYFTKVKKGEKALPPLDCDVHQKCPVTPCPSVLSQIVGTAIAYQANKEAISVSMTEFRAKMGNAEKVVLKQDEYAIKIGNQMYTLNEIKERKDLPINRFERTAVLVNFRAERTYEEMCSVYYQMECYRALSLDPSLLVHISPLVKEEMDKAHTLLAEKVVFPQLKMLNFEKVGYDPNGKNPENKRPFERVIYVKKG